MKKQKRKPDKKNQKAVKKLKVGKEKGMHAEKPDTT